MKERQERQQTMAFEDEHFQNSDDSLLKTTKQFFPQVSKINKAPNY